MDALQSSEKNHLESLNELICSLEQVTFKLTHKEELICLLLCKGYTAAEIANKLLRSIHTVQKQIKQLKSKTKIGSLHVLLSWYLVNGLKKVA